MFWKGVIGYLPANLVQAAVGLLTIVIFTRILSPDEYGHYALGFTVMTLVHTLLFTWNEAAMLKIGSPCWMATTRRFEKLCPSRLRSTW